MIKSMTGFGLFEASPEKGVKLSCYIKTLNHKNLNVTTRIPIELREFEQDITNGLKKTFKRGKIEAYLTFKTDNSRKTDFDLNLQKARTYYRMLNRLKKEFSLNGDINVALLSKFTDIFGKKELSDLPRSTLSNLVKKVLAASSRKAIESREKEGKAIYNDFKKRIKKIKNAMCKINKKVSQNLSLTRTQLAKKIRALKVDVSFDKNRLEQEILISAIKCDITEECVRLDNHVSQFENLLDKNSPVGKKMVFTLQEMTREITTLCAKAQHVLVRKKGAIIREEIERLREQAFNIE